MGVMEFRLAQATDIEAIARLFHSCWHQSYSEILSDEVRAAMEMDEAKKLWLPSLENPGDKETVLGFVEEKVAAVFRIGKDPREVRRGHLFSLYVEPALSGRGLGKSALDEAIRRLELQGFREITLWVFANNLIAQKLYRSRNFDLSGDKRMDERWQSPEIEMLRLSHERISTL